MEYHTVIKQLNEEGILINWTFSRYIKFKVSYTGQNKINDFKIKF